MAARNTPSAKAITPPKGRPTPARGRYRSQRTFGSTFQWIAAAGLIALAVVAGVLLIG